MRRRNLVAELTPLELTRLCRYPNSCIRAGEPSGIADRRHRVLDSEATVNALVLRSLDTGATLRRRETQRRICCKWSSQNVETARSARAIKVVQAVQLEGTRLCDRERHFIGRTVEVGLRPSSRRLHFDVPLASVERKRHDIKARAITFVCRHMPDRRT
jgi:hypothetical protein